MTEITEQTSKKIEQRSKKMLLELPIEYLNQFNKFKLEYSSDIRKNFYKSSQHEAFKYILRDYFRIREIEYKNLPIEIDNELINVDSFLKLSSENREKLDELIGKYNMDEDVLIKMSLKHFERFMEYQKKKKELEKEQNKNIENNIE